MVVFDQNVAYPFKEERVFVPVKRFKICIVGDTVVSDSQPVGRFGIDERTVERLEYILFNENTRVEEPLLILEVRYLGIDGDNGVCKLIVCSKAIDKAVVSDDHLLAGSGFVPSIAVPA